MKSYTVNITHYYPKKIASSALVRPQPTMASSSNFKKRGSLLQDIVLGFVRGTLAPLLPHRSRNLNYYFGAYCFEAALFWRHFVLASKRSPKRAALAIEPSCSSAALRALPWTRAETAAAAPPSLWKTARAAAAAASASCALGLNCCVRAPGGAKTWLRLT